MTDELPRRRLLDRVRGTSSTVIGPRTRFVGDIVTEGTLMLCGTFDGDGKVDGSLSITRGATWTGEIRTGEAVIAGTLIGNIVVTGKLEVGAKAVIRGKVVARTLAIARGAILEGEVEVTSGQPVIEFDEKRSGGDAPGT
jgi:cytoskeletal protein CcmA (bactofilin family)